jgi:hypothetical protein
VLVFLVVCIFDPADLILTLKVPVFIALWIATALSVFLSRSYFRISPELVIYVSVFILIPALSIILYYAVDGRQPFEGFAMIKAYLLVSFSIILVVNKIDLLPQLSAVLTILAVCVIAVFLVLFFNPALFAWMKSLAEPTGLLLLDRRSYGAKITLLQVYFVTSPMLLIAIAYYFDRAVTGANVGRKVFFSAITAIDVIGMFMAGSRNNIFASLLLLFLLWPLYTRRPRLYLLCSLAALAVMALPFMGYLSAFLDPLEYANSVKLATLRDYFTILSDPFTLLFGQGLGAYQAWSAKKFSFITELTYFEMIRNFGLLGTWPLMSLLLLPVENAFLEGGRQERSLAIAWLLYLVICFSNPNLFSSMGLLIYCVLLANVFLRRDRTKDVLPRDRAQFVGRG